MRSEAIEQDNEGIGDLFAQPPVDGGIGDGQAAVAAATLGS
jgi:hypothetical protein